MSKKRKNGFETFDFRNPIVVHSGAQAIGHGGAMLLFSDASPMPESWKDFYKENQKIIHLVLFVVLLAGVNKFV